MSSSPRKTINADNSCSHEAPRLAAFTSGDAHNGCRALFNGTAGWAFFGPAGAIDPRCLPAGTVSYPYDMKNKNGLFGGGTWIHEPCGGGGGGGRNQLAKRPGEGLSRKINDTRSAYLDAADLEQLVHGSSGDGGAGDDGGCYGAGVGGEKLRRGRPIVLTLQAILAATSPAAAAAVVAADVFAAFPVNATQMGAGIGETSTPTMTTKKNSCYPSARVASMAVPAAIAVADHAQFPPLMLRGASAEKGPGLFLAPPITMIKNSQPAEKLAAAEAAGAGAAGVQSFTLSCSEAVAATSVAEAAGAASTGETTDGGAGAAAVGGAGGGGMSRIGWWLRWATATNVGEDDNVEGSAPTVGGDNEAVGISFETRNGAEGWQVVSSSTVAAVAAAKTVVGDNDAEKTGDYPYPCPYPGATHGQKDEEDDEVGSWCDFAEEESIGETAILCSGPPPLAVRGGCDLRAAEEAGVGAAAASRGATVAEALERAASGMVWDHGGGFAGGDGDGDDVDMSVDGVSIDSINDDDSDNSAAVPQDVSPNVPRSFRDTLLAPSATGAVGFSDSKALLRARAAASQSPCWSSGPTVVDGGVNGGAVFLWRKAAAGEVSGDRAAERAEKMCQDEDPYYARKRVGAFAFKTKPRGKAHK